MSNKKLVVAEDHCCPAINMTLHGSVESAKLFYPTSQKFKEVTVSESLYVFVFSIPSQSFRWFFDSGSGIDDLKNYDASPLMRQEIESLEQKIDEGKLATKRRLDLMESFGKFLT